MNSWTKQSGQRLFTLSSIRVVCIMCMIGAKSGLICCVYSFGGGETARNVCHRMSHSRERKEKEVLVRRVMMIARLVTSNGLP